MTSQRDRNIESAAAVLQWNRQYLRHDAVLTEPIAAQCFAARLLVQPNGRRYDASLAEYVGFLQGMRRDMAGIEYEVLHTVADDEAVVLDMAVRIERLGGECEHFIAMLLMRFDAQGKVCLWKETYLPAVASPA